VLNNPKVQVQLSTLKNILEKGKYNNAHNALHNDMIRTGISTMNNIDKQVKCQPIISETSDVFHPGK
jgi:hypothetical protein